MLVHHSLQEKEEDDLPREGPTQMLHHSLQQEEIGQTHTPLGLDQQIGYCLVMSRWSKVV
jgi:hypothetical protein